MFHWFSVSSAIKMELNVNLGYKLLPNLASLLKKRQNQAEQQERR